MRWRIATLIVLAGALAGCVGEDTGSYELRGTFTEDASDEDMAELQTEVEDRGGRLSFLESFPVRFHAEELAADGCEEVRSFAQDADYVREVGECSVQQDSTNGDEPANAS